MYGYISTQTPAPDSTVRIKYGGNTVVETSVTLPANLSNQYFEFEFVGTARTIGETGTMIVQGRSILGNSSGLATVSMRQFVETAAEVIDTTISETLDVTYQWSAAHANNSITITNGTVELLRP